ncbi:hypothetical protein MMC28_010697 [Mycoblastus sanguinarius]|nr:hypothetical protein [Mycoblastus sanguinarius]
MADLQGRNFGLDADATPLQILENEDDGLIRTRPVSVTHPSNDAHVAPAIQSLGESSRRKHFKVLDLLALLTAWLCFAVSVITITPELDVAWRLGLKRQLQVIGLMLSIMNQCLHFLSPKLSIVVESRFGKSKLQNYDAILRNSIMVSHSGLMLRAFLLASILLPLGLSLAYKDFVKGYNTHDMGEHRSWYGMTGPAGSQKQTILKFGPTYMTNATLPFILASANSLAPPFSSLPQAYGFKTLLLSNSSTAYLDAPMPDQITSLQQNLDANSNFTLTADVHATVTTYNDSIETGRDDDDFWDFFYNQMNITSSDPVSVSRYIYRADLQSGKTVGLLSNYQADSSWTILSFFQSNESSGPPAILVPAFQANARLFNTRRDICRGTWEITYNSIQLVKGNCSESSLPNQGIFTSTDFGFGLYYLPILVELLAPFSTSSSASPSDQDVYNWDNQWLVPTFTTVVAAMYWSRATALIGFDNSAYYNDDPAILNEVYYQLPDTLLSTRQTMNVSWTLYFVLVIQPVLVTLVFLASLILSFSPASKVDGGNFGIIAILAGVQKDTLKLFDGASFSGVLKKPVRMDIRHGSKLMATERDKGPQYEYFFEDDGKSYGSLTAALRRRLLPSSQPFRSANKQTGSYMQL